MPGRGPCSVPGISLEAASLKIMAIVPLSFLNPHWLSGRSLDCSSFSFSRFSRFSRTLARTLPKIDNKEMPQGLSHS